MLMLLPTVKQCHADQSEDRLDITSNQERTKRTGILRINQVQPGHNMASNQIDRKHAIKTASVHRRVPDSQRSSCRLVILPHLRAARRHKGV